MIARCEKESKDVFGLLSKIVIIRRTVFGSLIVIVRYSPVLLRAKKYWMDRRMLDEAGRAATIGHYVEDIRKFIV